MKFKKWALFRSKRAHSVLRWFRYPFLVIGLLALSYCGYVLLDAKAFQAYETWRFERALKDVKPPDARANEPDATINPPPSEDTSPIIAKSAASNVPAGSPLGRMEINSIGLSVMIMEGIDGRTLRRAAGHIPGTALPGEAGNVGIAGHRDTFFRPLRNLQMNDEITLTTLKGVYRYRVNSLKLAEPNDIDVLKSSGDAVLTLVTCYPFYYVGPAPRRFIVRAVEIPEGQNTNLESNPPAKPTIPF
jgi:sortase A